MREKKSKAKDEGGVLNLGDLVTTRNLKKGRGDLKAPNIPHVKLTPEQVDRYRNCYHAPQERS